IDCLTQLGFQSKQEQKSSGEIKKKHILDIKDKLGKRHWLACESGEVLDDWLVTLLEARIKVPPALHISEFKKVGPRGSSVRAYSCLAWCGVLVFAVLVV
ncbi:hypothetical protein SARC_17834, partial [Sphaeroforma arctica JP610]